MNLDDPGTSPLIRLRGLAVVYPGPPEVTALSGVDLTINRGERVGVTGPSGSGKSTLLNVLGLLERPTGGTYELRSRDTMGRSDRELSSLRASCFGFVFQSSHVIADRTALANVALPMGVQGVPRSRRAAKASELLDSVGLSERTQSLSRLLSGGERQRLAIARALSGNPDVLLCDEPTGNLDSASGAAILSLLAALNDLGITILVVTHDPAVAAWADRVIEVRDGHVSGRAS